MGTGAIGDQFGGFESGGRCTIVVVPAGVDAVAVAAAVVLLPLLPSITMRYHGSYLADIVHVDGSRDSDCSCWCAQIDISN